MRRFYLHPLIYQIAGGLMMIVGALNHSMALVIVGAAAAVFGLIDMTFPNKD